MAKLTSSERKTQLETLTEIDSLITILGDYPEFTIPIALDVNPFGFLINLCKSLGIFDELLRFIEKLLILEIPLIELAVKGILLSNIKEITSCSEDPYIPNYLRKQVNGLPDSGITFTLENIDYTSLMDIHPLSNGSEYYYLGIIRQYKVEYKVVAPSEKQQVDYKEKRVSEKNKDKLINWVTSNYNKLSEKWTKKDTSGFTYVIKQNYEDDTDLECIDEDRNLYIYKETVEEIKTNRKGKEQKNTYIYYSSHLYVYGMPKSKQAETKINDVSEWDTFVKAESVLRTCKQKYKHKELLKQGYEITARIIPIVNTTPYELARAKDFNAFLWFLTHMSNFTNAINLGVGNFSIDPISATTGTWVTSLNESLKPLLLKYDKLDNVKKNGPLGVLKCKPLLEKEEEAPSIIGTVFNISNLSYASSIYHLCIKSEQDSKGKKEYTIVPATSEIKSLNWYGDRSKYYDFLKYYASSKTENEKSPRNYENEIGICNIKYESTVNNTSELTYQQTNQIRFTVLPKPLIHRPQYIDGEWPWKRKKLLFNTLGELDSKGKYSVYVTTNSTTLAPKCYQNNRSTTFRIDATTTYTKDDFPWYYEITTKGGNTTLGYLYIPSVWSKGIAVENTQGHTGTTIPFSCLYECYPESTVYSFNYDYVMSQRLLDPKVLVGQIIQSITNVKLGLSSSAGLNITRNKIEGNLRQVIIDMITGDTAAYTVNDCYNSFSNEKYDSLLTETENKKASGYKFEGSGRISQLQGDEISKILNELDDDDITQEGQIDVIDRAFRQAMVSITAETEDSESLDIKFDFITQILYDFIFSIAESLLTPKIIMLLTVNQKLMGDLNEWNDIKDITTLSERMSLIIIKNLIQILSQILKELKDTILKQLTDFVLGYLKPKFAELAALILKEYTEQYRGQIKALIDACGHISWFSGGASGDTTLDKVNYADIDPLTEIIPETEC